ncbi:MAG: hypothetical protein ACOZE5_09855, partial [Verrucomicrobiota bacterium]
PNDAGRAEIGAKTPSRELESAQKITKTRRAISKQGFFQQPANQILQIDYYKVHVENYRATIAGGPTVPMPPMPPLGP